MELVEAIHILQDSRENVLKLFIHPLDSGIPFLSTVNNSISRSKKHKSISISNRHIFYPKYIANRNCFCCSKKVNSILSSQHQLQCCNCSAYIHHNCIDNVMTCASDCYQSIEENKTNMHCNTPQLFDPKFDEFEDNNLTKNFWSLKILKMIGSGSYSDVFIAKNLSCGNKYYALKRIRKSSVKSIDDLKPIVAEAKILEICKKCNLCITMGDKFQDDDDIFFLTEFIPYGDLMLHLQRERKFTEPVIKFYMSQLVIALRFLHSSRIVYRDLKLDNILLNLNGNLKLTDFGMSKILEKDDDYCHTICGTPNYIAPEVISGERYRFLVDWWALGVLCFELSCGFSPFVVSSEHDYDSGRDKLLFKIIQTEDACSIKIQNQDYAAKDTIKKISTTGK
ncbi:MAG: hypothetical protein MHMPM18_000023 [Marteilia pararefringens]